MRRALGTAEIEEGLLALIIGAAAVVAFICSFAMFLQYMREDADDDDNSKRPADVNRVQSIAEGQALGAAKAQEGFELPLRSSKFVEPSILVADSCIARPNEIKSNQ